MRSEETASNLLATLGTEPQVVTAAMDLLLARGEQLRRVIVVHTSGEDEKILSAIETLQEVQGGSVYPNTVLELSPIEESAGRVAGDVDTLRRGEAAFRALFAAAAQLKRGGDRLHICIAGGRKTLALYGMAAAQMLFDENDRLWHLASRGEFLTSRRLHPGDEDDVELVPVPVLQWSPFAPTLVAQINTDDPYEALAAIRALQLEQKLETARKFVQEQLTEREREVVATLAREGGDDKEIARRLTISERTVEAHLRTVYGKAEQHWGLVRATRTHLIALLGLYFATEIKDYP